MGIEINTLVRLVQRRAEEKPKNILYRFLHNNGEISNTQTYYGTRNMGQQI